MVSLFITRLWREYAAGFSFKRLRNRRLIILFLPVFLLFIFPSNSTAQGKSPETSFTAVAPTSLIPLGLIKFYQFFISPTQVTSCPMSPNCSQYAYDAFKRYNPIVACLKFFDRFYRCGHDLDNYKVVRENTKWKFYDPISTSSSMAASDQGDNIQLSEATRLIDKKDHKSNVRIIEKPIDLKEEKRLFSFAKFLQQEGDYGRAITEYRRLLNYYPQTEFKREALMGILDCYYYSKNYKTVQYHGEQLLEESLVTNLDHLRILLASSYIKTDKFQEARVHLNSINKTTHNLLGDKAIILEGISYSKEGDWPKAEEKFSAISNKSEYKDYASKLIGLCRERKNLDEKSPALAGFLALVPGLGYLYDGFEQTAVVTFIVNGLLIWGTYESFQRDNDEWGWVLGAMSLGWYSGNIYGSVVSAERVNEKNRSELMAKINFIFPF